MSPSATGQSLILEPIGYVRCAIASKAEAARQPPASGVRGTIELIPGRHFEHALEDLAGWEFIWVIFWFHLNPGWRPKVLPPRSRSGRKGVFATRAPHRPNALGLSAVRLERLEGLTLEVSNLDMVDGTPVLDLKPYVAYTDAHPRARSGWLDVPRDPLSSYTVTFESPATEQAAWIEARTGLPIAARIRATLALGPAPHPYRRIRREGDEMRLAVKEWRIRFMVEEMNVRVLEIFSGYKTSQLAATPQAEPICAHNEFLTTWPPSSV